jgi:hypothetical protein
MQIEVDFEVWKALTLRRASEDVTYNAVLRDLLELPPLEEARPATPAKVDRKNLGYVAVGRYLPAGTKLRAKYKGITYYAEIGDGKIRSQGGKIFNSLSAAARDVTGNNVNGLRFWHAKRPADFEWTPVEALKKDVP